MKVLLICGKSISEVIFATPAIRALRIDLDDAAVHVLVRPEAAFLLSENPYVERVHSFTDFFSTCTP